MADPLARLRRALADDSAWWQLPLLGVLLGGVGLLLWVAAAHQTEFLYALF